MRPDGPVWWTCRCGRRGSDRSRGTGAGRSRRRTGAAWSRAGCSAPAARIEISLGDRVLLIGSLRQLGLILESFREGDTVTVTVKRDGRKENLRVKLGAVR